MIKIIIVVILSVAIAALILRSSRLEKTQREITEEAILQIKLASELANTSTKSTSPLLSLMYITRASQILNSVGNSAGLDTLAVRKSLKTQQEHVLNSIYKHYPKIRPSSVFNELLL